MLFHILLWAPRLRIFSLSLYYHVSDVLLPIDKDRSMHKYAMVQYMFDGPEKKSVQSHMEILNVANLSL